MSHTMHLFHSATCIGKNEQLPSFRLDASGLDKPQVVGEVPGAPVRIPAVGVESICRIRPGSGVAEMRRGLGTAGADQLPRGGLRDRQPEFKRTC